VQGFGLGFGVKGKVLGWIKGSGFKVQGSGFKV
jgi:hypothetical protein